MADINSSGRHRSPARYNPITELSGIVTSAGSTGVKASAVLAASGGLVAAFALPANATETSASRDVSTSATTQSTEATATVAAQPAIVAPTTTAPVRGERFGVKGVRAVAKPKPAPVALDAASATEGATRATGTVTNGRTEQATSSAMANRTVSTAASRAALRQPVASAPAPAPVTGGVVSIARSLLGIPYVYGGTTPAGFDCSGFTQYVYAKAGKSIPRTASAQQAAATRVSNPQPGDLVFMGYPAYHVGIYTGNGMMIDSPRSGKSTSERAIWDSSATFGRIG